MSRLRLKFDTIVEPLLCDTSIQGTIFGPGEMFTYPVIFVFATSIEGTPLFRGRDTFSGPQKLGLISNQGAP